MDVFLAPSICKAQLSIPSAPIPPATSQGSPAVANANPTGTTLSTSVSDSFNKEVSAKATIVYVTYYLPPGWKNDQTRYGNSEGKKDTNPFSPQNSLYVLNISANYDDKWKAGAPALSNVTQAYSITGVNINRSLGFPLTLLASEYHSNQQGILLDQEYGIGLPFPVLLRKPAPTDQATQPSGPCPGNEIDSASKGNLDPNQLICNQSRFLIVSAGLRGAFDKLSKHADSVNDFGPSLYSQFNWVPTKKWQISSTFKGFVPFARPESNGRVSIDISFAYKFAKQWSGSFEVTDTYFATVPAGYRDNSLTTTFGIKWTPQSPKGPTCPKCAASP